MTRAEKAARRAEQFAADIVDRVLERQGLAKAAGTAMREDLMAIALPVAELVLPASDDLKRVQLAGLREFSKGLKARSRKLDEIYKQGSGGTPWSGKEA
jgi:hypothetical protein